MNRRIWLPVAVTVGLALAAITCQKQLSNPVNSSGISGQLTDLSAGVPGVPDSAVVRFGNEEAGSPFPPQDQHDMSGHAKDNIIPGTVVIARGGSIRFIIDPFHQVSIFQPGKTPDSIKADIQSGVATIENLTTPIFIPNFVIDDPSGRIALSPPLTLTEKMWTTPPGTFDQPGRYLMACTTVPHFEVSNMIGWIIVK